MSTSLFALLDDVAAVFDDVAVMTSAATKKTAGILGDDLALNAEQVTGIEPKRELSVVWAVAKGSALNKAILVPLALVLSTATPWLITPLMLLGGAYLCFEGVEKLAHAFLRKKQATSEREGRRKALSSEGVDMVAFEKEKIRGAVRTDFILSAEIVVISLDSVIAAPLASKALTLILVSLIATVGIYGLVAGLVKLDDLGLSLRRWPGAWARGCSTLLLRGAPILMRTLSVVGIAAVFLVGGGIIAHSIDRLKRWSAQLETKLSELEGIGSALAAISSPSFDAAVGLAVGGVSLALVTGGRRVVGATRG